MGWDIAGWVGGWLAIAFLAFVRFIEIHKLTYTATIMALSGIFIVLVTVLSSQVVYGCFESCTIAFNQKMSEAARSTDLDVVANTSCSAVKEYSNCMKQLMVKCETSSKPMLLSTIQSVDQNYNTTCRENASEIVGRAIECTNKATQCYQTSNIRVLMSQTNIDPVAICSGLDYYTNCTEELMISSDCSQYMGFAATKLEATRNHLAKMCAPDASGRVNGQNAMLCFNQTLDCYDKHGDVVDTVEVNKDIERMCKGFEDYTRCVTAVIKADNCQQYAPQIERGMQQTNYRHSALCGQDSGKTASRCMKLFDECHRPFNASFSVARQSQNFVGLCESVNGIGKCTAKIPSECLYYLGKALAGVEQIQRQYSYRCAKENRQHFACKPLEDCTKMYMSSFIQQKMSRTASSMCTKTVDTLFPCVENALKTCNISENGVTVQKVATVGKGYCSQLTEDKTIRNCRAVMMCQMNVNFTMSDPLQMTNATFWCGYVGSSVDCINGVIERNGCPNISPEKKTSLLKATEDLKRNVADTCTVPKIETVVETELPSDDLNETNEGKSKDQRKSKDQGGKASSLQYGFIVMLLSLFFSFNYHS
ncbi:hypothetical protein LOTGIDRAFT_233348 [Lottia gigantea]|uniref:DUF19 domain-containing protein n=1 Tax=Lottia gigantea TaxID=225164 RepID=V4A4X8_LOTGI|nr:hypothetical protein LOTGIDRAFT_233348 [Lottia gigantea]ESO91767.1 hypothetical protein LOTGIDRAFT_233348 [Lottia gigantea]